MLEFLFLCIGGYFGGHEFFLMRNQDGILKIETLYISDRSYPDCKRKTVRRSLVMTKERSKRWLQKFEQVQFENWAEEYWNNHILDGTQWNLVYKNIGQVKRRCHGSNEYPENWANFHSLIRKLTETSPAISVNEDSENDIDAFLRLCAEAGYNYKMG